MILIAGLAGCIAAEDDQTGASPSPTYTTGLEARYGASFVDNGTLDDWFLVSTSTDTDGQVRGFRWSIPDGAIEDDQLLLEFAPFVPENGTVDGWTLYAFREEGGSAELVATILAPSLNVKTRLAVIADEMRVGPLADPFLYNIWAWELEEGDDLLLVLAAGTPETAEVGLGFRVADQDTEPAENTEEFVNARGGRPPIAPTGLGAADSFQTAAYVDVSFLGALGSEMWTDSMTVEDRFPIDLRPTLTTRDVTVSTAFASDEGWTYGAGVYLGYNGAGTWSVDVHARESAAAGRSIYAHNFGTPALLGTFLLLGLPLWGALGEGVGEDSVRVDLTIANVDYVEIFQVVQLSLGAPLSDVIGMTTDPAALVYTGLLGDLPPQVSGEYTPAGLVSTMPDGSRHLLLGFEQPQMP